MPIDPLPIWKAEYAKLPQDPTGFISPTLISQFVDERVTNKLDIAPTTVKFDPTPKYTWLPAIFEAALRSISPVPSVDPISPNTKLAAAWASATLSAQLIIAPGAKMNPPPTGTNGIAATATAAVDPGSVSAAQSDLVAGLIAAPPAAAMLDAKFPEVVYDAFNAIQFMISGIDTTPTPAGPIPFNLTAKAF